MRSSLKPCLQSEPNGIHFSLWSSPLGAFVAPSDAVAAPSIIEGWERTSVPRSQVEDMEIEKSRAQRCGRLLVQLGPDRAEQASHPSHFPGTIPEVGPAMVVVRTDLSGFCDLVAKNLTFSKAFLCEVVRTIRNQVIGNQGLFEKHVGDRTISVFSNWGLMGQGADEDEKCLWIRALKAVLGILTSFEEIISTKRDEFGDELPYMRVGVAGGQGANIQAFSSMDAEEEMPPEIVSFAYDNSFRSIHGIAYDLCDLALDATVQEVKDDYERLRAGFPPSISDELALRLRESSLKLETLVTALIHRAHRHAMVFADAAAWHRVNSTDEVLAALMSADPRVRVCDFHGKHHGRKGTLSVVIPYVANEAVTIHHSA